MESISERDDDVRRRLLERREVMEATGCWRYDGATTGAGYGGIWWAGQVWYAHRVSAMFFLGLDPQSGLFVLHRCDERACFNPDHLFIGTQQDNMRDAASKGRMGKKLTPEKVATIKYQLATRSSRSLALEYGVSTSTIGQIKRNETWKCVEPQPTTPSDDTDNTAGNQSDSTACEVGVARLF